MGGAVLTLLVARRDAMWTRSLADACLVIDPARCSHGPVSQTTAPVSQTMDPAHCSHGPCVTNQGAGRLHNQAKACKLHPAPLLLSRAGVTAADVADILLSQAITLRSKDDISILVVEVRPMGKAA